ncbi:TIGR00296 family protein [Candidatus Woesearchaeota archaeon]|nr:TIGR00296 family protein [Candidatus Woesearchaeota archaeon]
MLNLEQGARLVKLARKAIQSKFSILKLKDDKKMRDEFSEMLGCFVTLHKNSQLRGCIGFPEPVMPLYDGIVRAAESAAFKDPRFPPVEKDELGLINVEISVLTRPRRIDVRNPEDYVKHIRVGRDGLIVRETFNSGLLLPQVATEQRWDALNFLRQTCVKANLKPDDWQDFDRVRVYKFQSQVFGESSPEGEVLQVM